MRKKDSDKINKNFRQQNSSLKVVEKEVVTEQQKKQSHSVGVLEKTSSSVTSENQQLQKPKRKFGATEFEGTEFENTHNEEILDFINEDVEDTFSLDDFNPDRSLETENDYYDNSSSPVSYSSSSKSYNARYVAPKSKITNYQPETKLHRNQKFARLKTFREQQDEHTEKFFKKDDGSKLQVENSSNEDSTKFISSLNKEHKSNDLSNNNQPQTSKKSSKVKSAKLATSKLTQKVNETAAKGLEKYQTELEKDDAGVEVTSKVIKERKLVTKNARKLSAVTFQKLKDKKFHIDLEKDKKSSLISVKEQGEHIEPKTIKGKKPLKNKDLVKSKSTIKKISSTPVALSAKSIKSGVSQYQNELEKDDIGVKLASQSSTQVARAAAKLSKGSTKAIAQSSKLKQANKLKTAATKINNPKTANKLAVKPISQTLKKQQMKKKMYAPLRQSNAKKKFVGAVSSMGNKAVAFIKSFASLKLATVKKVIAAVGAKIATAVGGGGVMLLPIIIVAVISLLVVGALSMGKMAEEQENASISGGVGSSMNLSPNVEKWREAVQKEAKAQGMENYVGLILAIIQIETGGTGTPDIMQSSESMGLPVNTLGTEESIRQGIKHLKGIISDLSKFKKGYENNVKLIAQSYNFGKAFATYVGKRGGEYSLGMAEDYSRTVVAPSLGNHNGATTSYVNATSVRVGKTYRYINGGNFLYGEMVSEYVGASSGADITGEFKVVMDEVLKYEGWSYVWGGKSPTAGFDCSGLVSWGLQQIGVSLPSPASNQYAMTKPISPSEAKPGDLIFFRGTYGGPNHISHVAFYVDSNTMYDSNSSGVGYHQWNNAHWKQYRPEIRRIQK